MTHLSPLHEYQFHLEALYSAFCSDLGARETEQDIFAVVRLLDTTTDLKERFLDDVQKLLGLADPGHPCPDIPAIELVEVVAHELGWNELRALLEARLLDTPPHKTTTTGKQVVKRILRAFDPEWSDREIYRTYSSAP